MLGESPPRVHERAQHGARGSRRYNGLAAEPLYHPPPLAGRLHAGPYGDYVLSVGRLEGSQARRPRHPRAGARRRAAAAGRRRRRARSAAQLEQRRGGQRRRAIASTFAGGVDERRARSISTPARSPSSYAPFDEDYGYVTLEAFLARKPVITTTDAGGTLEFVERRRQRLRRRARRRKRSARRSRGSPPIAARAQRARRRRAATARARSPGTASWIG